jgi:NADPH:quinone reductase-like Zn-dependent oxidoreductase
VQAAVYRKFGGPEVVRIEDVPKPSPQSDEVLIKVYATTVSVADHRMRSRDLPKGLWFLGPVMLGVFGPRKPVLGMDIAGIVEAVGDNVTRFKPGDAVIGLPGSKFGGHAEYLCMPENGALTLKPGNMNFEEAVTLVFGGQTALRFLRRAKIKPGDEVLVNGASSAVGTAAVQLAKHFGAVVTGVCSGGNAGLARSLGADHVIDYAKEDFARNGKTYDIIVECVGNAPFERVNGAIKPGGALLLVISDLKGMLAASRNSRKSGKLVTWSDSTPLAEELESLVKLAEAGAYRAVTDRTYEFDEIVEAHRYVDTGRKKGNVVLRIAPPPGHSPRLPRAHEDGLTPGSGRILTRAPRFRRRAGGLD